MPSIANVMGFIGTIKELDHERECDQVSTFGLTGGLAGYWRDGMK